VFASLWKKAFSRHELRLNSLLLQREPWLAQSTQRCPAEPRKLTRKHSPEKAFSYAEVNIKAACDLAEKLVHAKNAQEFLQLQSEFVAAQLETLREQTNDLSSAIQNAMIWTPKP
jgi:Phasin protein